MTRVPLFQLVMLPDPVVARAVKALSSRRLLSPNVYHVERNVLGYNPSTFQMYLGTIT